MVDLTKPVEFALKSDKLASTTITDLVNKLHNYDEEALIQLYQRYGSLVYSIAFQTLGNEQDAEEVTQDVFLRIWEKSRQFDSSRGKFIAWLTTIARNSAIDRLRKRNRHGLDSQLVSLDDTPQLWETISVDNQDDDLRRSIASAMHHLTTEQREAIVLAYFYGMSQAEIADQLQRPLGTVKSHIRQGMQRLRELWLSQKL